MNYINQIENSKKDLKATTPLNKRNKNLHLEDLQAIDKSEFNQCLKREYKNRD